MQRSQRVRIKRIVLAYTVFCRHDHLGIPRVDCFELFSRESISDLIESYLLVSKIFHDGLKQLEVGLVRNLYTRNHRVHLQSFALRVDVKAWPSGVKVVKAHVRARKNNGLLRVRCNELNTNFNIREVLPFFNRFWLVRCAWAQKIDHSKGACIRELIGALQAIPFCIPCVVLSSICDAQVYLLTSRRAILGADGAYTDAADVNLTCHLSSTFIARAGVGGAWGTGLRAYVGAIAATPLPAQVGSDENRSKEV